MKKLRPCGISLFKCQHASLKCDRYTGPIHELFQVSIYFSFMCLCLWFCVQALHVFAISKTYGPSNALYIQTIYFIQMLMMIKKGNDNYFNHDDYKLIVVSWRVAFFPLLKMWKVHIDSKHFQLNFQVSASICGFIGIFQTKFSVKINIVGLYNECPKGFRTKQTFTYPLRWRRYPRLWWT